MKIISISGFQGYIDWTRVRDADAAVVRFSHGGDNDCCIGISPETEELAERNLRGAYCARIACGVSHRLGAVTASEVRAEAAWLIAALKVYRPYLTLPIVAISLGDDGISPKYRSFSPSHNAALVKLFCTSLTRAGYTPVLCADRETLDDYLDRRKLGRVGIWYQRPFVSEAQAQAEEPDMLFWQYSAETSPKNAGISADYPVSRTENFFFEPPAPRIRRSTCRMYA